MLANSVHAATEVTCRIKQRLLETSRWAFLRARFFTCFLKKLLHLAQNHL